MLTVQNKSIQLDINGSYILLVEMLIQISWGDAAYNAVMVLLSKWQLMMVQQIHDCIWCKN